jgi:hypothetical protein
MDRRRRLAREQHMRQYLLAMGPAEKLGERIDPVSEVAVQMHGEPNITDRHLTVRRSSGLYALEHGS